MRLQVPDLFGNALDTMADDPTLVMSVLKGVEDRDPDVPFLLLPVRVETRFGRAEVPDLAAPAVDRLAERLQAVAAALQSVGARDLAVRLPGGGPQRREVKRGVEGPLVERTETDLDAAAAALGGLDLLVRDVSAATPTQLAAVQRAVEAVQAALAAAASSVQRARSDYHRGRLTERLGAIAPAATALLAAATRQVGAAERLTAALPHGGPAGIPRYRLLESVHAVDELDALLADPDRLAAAGGAERAQALCTQIAALPADWKDRVRRTAEVRSGLPADHPVRTAVQGLAELPARPAARAAGDAAGAAGRAAGQVKVVDQLRVRIFPDDVAVQSFDPRLTEAEVAAGGTFWTASASSGDEASHRAAWRALAAKLGPNRAAWVARQTRPPDPPKLDERVTAALTALATLDKRLQEVTRRDGKREPSLFKALDAAVAALRGLPGAPETALDRIRQLVGGLVPRLRTQLTDAEKTAARIAALERAAEAVQAVEEQPVSPSVAATRSEPLARRPGAGLLPDRFAVATVTAGQVSHIAVGQPVPADLAVAPDPTEVVADGDVPGSIRWLTDFSAAVDVGMALSFTITAQEAQNGFDRVYVLGLGKQADPVAAATELADLLDGHHYGPTGLALVAVGTPTNATTAATSGWSSRPDVEAAFDVEAGDGLVTGAADPRLTEGGRLAHALGLADSTFDHLAGAGDTGVTDAVTANDALWPATFGYALSEELGGLVGPGGRDRLQALASRFVSGRGVLPTVRVGPMPYGVLPTTAFSRWVGGDDFERRLTAVLDTMWQDWSAIRDRIVPHAHSPNITDPQQHVLDVLGLDATAAELAQRFTVNAGRQVGAAGATLHVGLPGTGEAPNPAGAFALLDRFASVLAMAGRGAGDLIVKGAVATPWADTFDRISASRAYEVRLLGQTVPLDALPAPADLASQVNALVSAPLWSLPGRQNPGQPLVMLLLRQALLVQAREVALRVVVQEGLLDEDLLDRLGSGALFRFATAAGDVRLTRWSLLLDQLTKVVDVLSSVPAVATSPLPGYLAAHGATKLVDYVNLQGRNELATGYPAATGTVGHAALLAPAQAHADAVRRLGALSPSAVDALVAEHLDLCSHRLDAWLLALPAARLESMRQKPGTGVHVGAFGWLEGLKPNPLEDVPASGVPPVLDDDPARPVLHDRNNEGFVHAPSLNHAVTAAVLRSGYLTEQAGGASAARAMAVNLTSRRTRTALDVLDGMATGNELGALLGYHFERALAEGPLTADGAGLQVFVARLRKAFPSVVPVAASTGEAPASADERAERLVVDGLRLLQRVQGSIVRGAGTLLEDLRSGSYAGHPWGMVDAVGAMLPARGDVPALEAVLTAVDAMADTVDALGDLVLTEGVYQLVQGNHPRAAAVLSALAEGRVPPRPQVVDTPVRGQQVSYRLLVPVPAVAAGSDPRDDAWQVVPRTPRSDAEPGLNRWLAALLGPPGATRVRLVDTAGDRAGEVTLSALGLQPVDLLALLHDGFEQALPELAARAIDALRPVDVLDEPAALLQVDLGRDDGWGPQVRSLPETAALLEPLGAALTAGRAADASDLVLADTGPGAATASAASGVDVADLTARADQVVDQLRDAAMTMLGMLSDGAANDPALLTGDPEKLVEQYREVYRGGAARGEHLVRLDVLWERRSQLHDALLLAGAFGVTGVTPPTRWLTRVQVGTELLEAAESAFVSLVRRLTAAGAATGTGRELQLGRLRAVLGQSTVVLPLFTPRNGDELAAGLAEMLTARPGSAVTRWLTGVAPVREAVGALTAALTVADAFGAAVPAGRLVQLPVLAGDTWLGEETTSTTPAGDRLALVLLGVDELDVTGPSAGFLVDSFTEVVPAPQATTGLTFHYDVPDATPPQDLLLVVPPDPAAGWRWEDLLVALHDTLELAKDRAVEPQHLQGTLYAQLLPALLGEVPAGEDATGTGGHRVVLDFADARATEA